MWRRQGWGSQKLWVFVKGVEKSWWIHDDHWIFFELLYEDIIRHVKSRYIYASERRGFVAHSVLLVVHSALWCVAQKKKWDFFSSCSCLSSLCISTKFIWLLSHQLHDFFLWQFFDRFYGFNIPFETHGNCLADVDRNIPDRMGSSVSLSCSNCRIQKLRIL